MKIGYYLGLGSQERENHGQEGIIVWLFREKTIYAKGRASAKAQHILESSESYRGQTFSLLLYKETETQRGHAVFSSND